MSRKIILDCDPGLDDAVAFFLAAGHPDIDLLAVTTVGGNATLDNVTRNALCLASMIGLDDVPIAAGCGRPLVREVENSAHIHGATGLGGVELPDPSVELDPRHGVDVIIDTVMAHEPGEVTLVPVGPLTNIAMAARKEPRIVERVREVVLMGGGYHTGNATPVAEFNVYADPHAAAIVFAEAWPVVMFGLDVTHQAIAGPEVLERLRALDTAPSRLLLELLGFYGEAYLASGRDFGGPPVHDPCAVAYVLDPQVATVRRAPVAVETEGRLTTGMTVTDLRTPAPADCTTSVATDLDRDRFWGHVYGALEQLG